MACERVKRWLHRAGVAFVARNVDEDDAAYDALLALGVRTVPATVVGDVVITGFDEPALRRAFGVEAP